MDRTLTCAKALANVIRVKCMMKLKSRVPYKVFRLISHQLRHPWIRQKGRILCPFYFEMKILLAFRTGQGHPTGPRSEWSEDPCCGGWGRCRYQEETPHWRGEGWARRSESWLGQRQLVSSLQHQMDTCDLCSGGPATTKAGFMLNATRCWEETWFRLLHVHQFHCNFILCSKFVFNRSLWGYWTFHSADLMLTVRPLLVRVLFIRRKKLMSLGISFIGFLFKPENHTSETEEYFIVIIQDRTRKCWGQMEGQSEML